jgi:glutathione S-transferase
MFILQCLTTQGEHKSPAFLEKQPFGQVPYLDDDGFILFESRAMARYIAMKYGNGQFIPSELKAGMLRISRSSSSSLIWIAAGSCQV